jgi:membrane protein DedA with SNARE-associated domain
MKIIDIILELEYLYLNFGYLIVFISSFIEISPMGWAIPGGTLLAVGGFFAYGNRVTLLIILIFGWAGAFLTFLLAYFLGRQTGYQLVIKLRQEKNAIYAKELLNKHGGVILTTSMLSNLTRFWVAYIAGKEQYSFLRFLFYSGIASLAWSSLFITIGYFAGSERAILENGLTRLGVLAWILFLIAGFVIYLKAKKEFKQMKKKK